MPFLPLESSRGVRLFRRGSHSRGNFRAATAPLGRHQIATAPPSKPVRLGKICPVGAGRPAHLRSDVVRRDLRSPCKGRVLAYVA
jgi:hypothetical protein